MTGPCDTAWLDGRYLPLAEARISPLDRGFLFADAVYEVLPVYGGRVFLLEPHLARLERSLAALRIASPHDAGQWRRLIGGLVTHNGGGDLLVYLQVSRGAEAGRSHVPQGSTPTVFAFASRTPPPPTAPPPGIAAITAADTRWARCDIKSTALLANILLKWQAEEAGAAEALLLRDGHLTEGSSSSVHVVTGGVLHSPPLTPEVLPGTTRELLLELARRCGFESRVCTIPEAQLRGAEEIIVASAGGGMRAATVLDGQPVGVGVLGPVFLRIFATLVGSRAEFSTEVEP
ncbi:MAG: aminotransferase class IV [Steroidobacteraceae bacterium]|nr:aminotransferase class IV [Steroidobacteraceae bacterium]